MDNLTEAAVNATETAIDAAVEGTGFFTALFGTVSNFWEILSEYPLAYLTGLEFIFLLAFVYGSYKLAKYMFKTVFSGLSTSGSIVKKMAHYNQVRASKIVCPHCGRTLDKCVCPTNKGVSNGERIRKYKKEKKARKLLESQGK